jgi:tyrocidine synthetase-3
MPTNESIHHKLVKDYWIAKLLQLELPSPTTNATLKSGQKRRKTVDLPVPEVVTAQIAAITNNQQVMEYILYLAFFNALSQRYFQAAPAVVASPTIPIADVTSKTISDETVLFLKFPPLADHTIKEYLDLVRKEVQSVIAYQEIDSNALLAHLEMHGGITPSDLYQVGFYYQGWQMEAPFINKIDWLLEVKKITNGCVVSLKYNPTLFKDKLAAQFIRHYIQFLESGISNLDGKMGMLDFLSSVERTKLVHGYNKTKRIYPKSKNIHKLFEARVKMQPDELALVTSHESLTYAALNAKADKLAYYLRSYKEVQADALVGILMNRSSHWIIGILGVLKAGAAYLPIDPNYPQERKQWILNDARPSVLLTHSDFLFDISGFQGEVFALDLQLEALESPV